MKNKLSCESYYWLVCNSKTGGEAFKDKTSWGIKFSLFNLGFYFIMCFIFNADNILKWIVGILNLFIFLVCLINLVSSKKKTENIALINFVLVFINIIILILNMSLSAFLWFYEECWDTNFQYVGIIIWFVGLGYIIFQFLKITIRLWNGYYDKKSEKPPESNYKKILTLSLVSLVPMVLAFGSRKAPFIRDLIGEEYFATYMLYISTLMAVLLAEALSMMFYYIKWHYKYSKEERENLLADYKGDKK